MAIRNRRGPYNKFDPTKLLPGEWAVVLSGDPHASDGLACYMCFAPGTVKRMATYEDMVDNIAESSGEAVAVEVDRQCKAAIQACQTAASNAGSAASAANTAAGNANTAVSKANTAANSANTAATAANEAAQAAQNVIQGDLSSNTVTFTTASTRTNILSGESLAVMFGKIKKWLSSLKNAAFADVANNLTTSAEGSVLDARQGKELKSQIDQLNTKITYKKWCEENGMTNIIDKAPEGLSFWSANPNDKPAVGMPSGFLEYGTYIIFKGSEYPVLLYVSVTGEAAAWGTNNGAWKILS